MTEINDEVKLTTKENLFQLMKYAFYAGIATVIDIGVLYLLTQYFLIYYLLSAAISYVCGMITNYSLNKYLTFKNTSKRIGPQFGLFLIVALIGLGLNELIIFLLVEYYDLWYIYAKVVSVCIVMFWSFIGHKKLTFTVIE